jgi:hypothetical protein
MGLNAAQDVPNLMSYENGSCRYLLQMLQLLLKQQHPGIEQNLL